MVALKIPIFRNEERQKAQRFQAEAKAAGRLRHPNIVPTFDSGKIGNHYFIASQYIDGKAMSDIIGANRIAFSEAARWCSKIA
ncbi:hypothetical protein ABK046_45200, partial [Streptomyces caeruleatus]